MDMNEPVRPDKAVHVVLVSRDKHLAASLKRCLAAGGDGAFFLKTSREQDPDLDADIVLVDLASEPSGNGGQVEEGAQPMIGLLAPDDWRNPAGGAPPSWQALLPRDLGTAALLQRILRSAIAENRARRDSAASEGRFRSLIEASPDAILICQARRVIYANAAARSLLRADGRTLLGQDPLDFAAAGDGGVLKALLGRGGRHRVECRLRAHDGSIIDAEITLVSDEVGDAFEMIIHDIAERHFSEAHLRLSAAAFEAAGDAMVITDSENRIVAVNPAFIRLTGYRDEEVIGRNPNILASGRHDKGFYAGMWKDLNTLGRWHGEIWNRRKDGQLFAERLSISLIRDSEGRLVNHVGVFSDITNKINEMEDFRYRANFDALTSLPNRFLLRDRLAQAISRANRDGGILGVLYVDLDGFKPVNDRFGHVAGDVVLAEVAARLKLCVRESDTVARIGGDEFVLMLPEMALPDDAEMVAAKILLALADVFHLEGGAAKIGASIGIAVYPADGTSVDDLLAAADAAMYRAKRSGRGRYVMATLKG